MKYIIVSAKWSFDALLIIVLMVFTFLKKIIHSNFVLLQYNFESDINILFFHNYIANMIF